jgi:hypothetical protein
MLLVVHQLWIGFVVRDELTKLGDLLTAVSLSDGEDRRSSPLSIDARALGAAPVYAGRAAECHWGTPPVTLQRSCGGTVRAATAPSILRLAAGSETHPVSGELITSVCAGLAGSRHRRVRGGCLSALWVASPGRPACPPSTLTTSLLLVSCVALTEASQWCCVRAQARLHCPVLDVLQAASTQGSGAAVGQSTNGL